MPLSIVRVDANMIGPGARRAFAVRCEAIKFVSDGEGIGSLYLRNDFDFDFVAAFERTEIIALGMNDGDHELFVFEKLIEFDSGVSQCLFIGFVAE